MKQTHALFAVALLVVLGVVARIVPHAPNFAPVAAATLLAGVFLPRRWSLVVPLGAMILSDAFIGFHNLVLFTWGSMVVSAMLGWWVRTRGVTTGRVVLAAIAGSVQFFLATNFAVWAMGAYARDLSGLWASYLAGLPFLRNTVLGDLFFAAVLFGAVAAANAVSRTKVPVPTR